MPGRYRRPTTPEQREKATQDREAKLAALHDTLSEQVSSLAAGPQWRAWLEVAAKFHNYSFGNTLLIMAQKPQATQVAGYTLWNQLGRQVDKGQKGVAILAPVTRKIGDEESGEPTAGAAGPTMPATVEAASTRRRVVVAFRPAYVWDVSQTSGEPLPAAPMPTLLSGQAPDGLWDALAAQVQAAGFTVDRREIAGDDGPNGYTAYATHEVVVRADVDDAQAVKTLAHELGHVLMHDPAGFADGETRQCRGAQEVEAESMAYLVAADHGLDTAEYTFAYVAHWAATTGDVDAALRASGSRTLTTAHAVLGRTHDYLASNSSAATAPAAVSVIDSDALAIRTAAGADRANALRHSAEKPARDPEPDLLHRDRLTAANGAAASYFISQYAGSWAPSYLADRIGTSELADRGIGYAPAGWTKLTEHLRGQGFSDAEIIGAGLGTRTSTGRVIDRFRDRLMFPIQARDESGGREVVGFIGRRNPIHDATSDTRNPKYLNTAQTALYTKGEHLYGLAENVGTIERGGLAVLVEGPIDALAVDVATRGMLAGVSPLGTSLTDVQAAQLAAALPAGSDRVVVATDADRAGQHAAGRAYALLTAHGLDPRGASSPPGLDPAATLGMYGPAMLMSRLTGAEPMGRQLVEAALTGRELTWAQDQVDAARLAVGIILKAPPGTWEREIVAVTDRSALDMFTLRQAVIDGLGTDTDALGRLTGRDRREDLDRGQHVQATPAQLAAMSGGRTGTIRPKHGRPTQTAHPAQALATSQGRGRH